MGTTVTVAWLVNGKCCWAHVGDSRLYLYRNGRLFQLTADQTRNEFARRDGRPTVADGEHLVQSFIYGSRGMGDNASLRLEHGLDSGAEVLHVGDRLLLCSDGLTGVLGDDTLALALSRFPDPQQACLRLRELALHGGSRDNVTVLVVRIDELPKDDVDEWLDDPEETVQF
jgi:protein phosphatase